MKETSDTEKRILEAAKAIFIRDGWHGARMEDIAREAAVNKALLHYYFRSKRKLFDEIFKSLQEDFIPKLHIVFAGEKSVLEKMEALVEEYLEMLQKNPFIPLFLINEAHKNPEQVVQHSVIPQFFQQAIPGFFSQVQAEVAAGKIKPVQPLHLLLNTLSMCVFPVLARPMLQQIMQLEESVYQEILAQRKAGIMAFIKAALQP